MPKMGAMRTNVYREQHRGLTAIAARLDERLAAADSAGLRTLLSELAGTLRVHLAMEDQRMYPKLVMSRDDAVARVARELVGEVGGVREAFESYLARWPSDREIASNRARFDVETRAMLATLADRIRREDELLFPLLEDLDELSQVSDVSRFK